jgi:hypothetical protein
MKLTELRENIATAEAGDAATGRKATREDRARWAAALEAGRELLLDFIGTEEQQEEDDAALVAAGRPGRALLLGYVRERIAEVLEGVPAERALRLAKPAHRTKPPEMLEEFRRQGLFREVANVLRDTEQHALEAAGRADRRLAAAKAAVAEDHGMTVDHLNRLLGKHLRDLLVGYVRHLDTK